MSLNRSGVFSNPDQTTGNVTFLPLESLDAQVFIADISARVVLSQTYSHHERHTLSEAYYIFPVPARAAVCGFEMQTEDGRRLKGVVEDLAQAKAKYEEAKAQGWLTGLLQQFREDGEVYFYLVHLSLFTASLYTLNSTLVPIAGRSCRSELIFSIDFQHIRC